MAVPVAQAQDEAAVTLAGYETLASFQEAVSLALDARGRLYVVDRGREQVVQLDPDGTERIRLGGPGGGDGEFDEPLDIDPRAGLTWLVADAGNGRLQRFSQTLLLLETLAVPHTAHFEPGTPSRLEAREDVLRHGWPVAVSQSPTGETFAIEAFLGVVLKWDRSRRMERVIGGFDQGAAALATPVDLVADTDHLYVADAGLQAIVVYDLFGGHVRTMAQGLLADVTAIALDGSRLWVVSPSRLLVMDARGGLLHTIAVRKDLSLVDAAISDATVFVLTPTTLLRAQVVGL